MPSDQLYIQPRGFYELYSIDVRNEDDDADPNRAKQKGLNSPYGRRGSICAHFHWTWDYLHNGISWAIVQRIMSDLPYYDTKETGLKDKEEKVLTSENAEDIAAFINNMV